MMPSTLSAPRARTARPAATAESMPPDRPTTRRSLAGGGQGLADEIRAAIGGRGRGRWPSRAGPGRCSFASCPPLALGCGRSAAPPGFGQEQHQHREYFQAADQHEQHQQPFFPAQQERRSCWPAPPGPGPGRCCPGWRRWPPRWSRDPARRGSGSATPAMYTTMKSRKKPRTLVCSAGDRARLLNHRVNTPRGCSIFLQFQLGVLAAG